MFIQNFYRPQTKLQRGNVFTPVCHSVCRGACVAGGAWQGACMTGSMHRGGRGHVWGVCMAGGMCGRGVCMVGGEGMHGRRDGHCCGRYASYWNAFLLLFRPLKFSITVPNISQPNEKLMINFGFDF